MGVSASKSRHTLTKSTLRPRFVVCVDPGKHDDLQARRIYRVLPDLSASKSNYIRVIDDSGEDYLYPERLFLPLHLTSPVREVIGELSLPGV